MSKPHQPVQLAARQQRFQALKRRAFSSAAKKLVTGLTGLALVSFVLVHLAGNLLLFAGREPFNEYAHFLERELVHGWPVIAAEIGLIAVFGGHIIWGLAVQLSRRRARPVDYAFRGDAGGTSKKTLSSRTMLYTGIVLGVFVVVHVAQMKFNMGFLAQRFWVDQAEGYRDLYQTVATVFQNWLWVAFYVGTMVLLGLHLRHGIWSAFHSVGVSHPRALPLLYTGAAVLAVLIAAGFLLLPIYVHFYGEHILAPGGSTPPGGPAGPGGPVGPGGPGGPGLPGGPGGPGFPGGFPGGPGGGGFR